VPVYRIGDLKKNSYSNNNYTSSSDVDSDIGPYGNGNGNGNTGGKGNGKGGSGSGKGANGIVTGGGSVKGPWYLSGVFWKRASVVISIIFSIASLILGAFASLRPGDKEHLRGEFIFPLPSFSPPFSSPSFNPHPSIPLCPSKKNKKTK
jgi:hypothetical protein